jgi:hypothetical protein
LSTLENYERVSKARKRKAVRGIYRVLAKEFPDELRKWSPEERKAFKDHLHEKLNMRSSSYKTQLKSLFAELHKRAGLTYTDCEIDVVERIRNTVFHTGIADSWEDVLSALNLLERTVLAVLGYAGDTNPIEASRSEE